jgi:tyrosinase
MPEPAQSRYVRFRQIMEKAAGTSGASYDGHDRFWNLPLDELRHVKLYGLAMLLPDEPVPTPGAPAPSDTSCCHHDAPAPSGCGAASGLVRGLRGQFPFDGTQFPPLLWGGGRVAEPDIQMIEQWIDDGCPATDHDAAAKQQYLSLQALATGAQAHAEHAGPVNEIFAAAGSIKQRKSIANLSDEEWSRLRAAFRWMKSFDAYWLDERSFGYWARIHASQCQHGWEEFLTWHRAYLYGFELKLQDYDPTVSLPYWDWTDESAQDVLPSIADQATSQPPGAALPPALDNGIIPIPFRCWIDDAGLANLTAGKVVPDDVLAALHGILYDPKNPDGTTFSSGSRLFAAATIAYGANQASDQAIIAELERINPLFHWRRWPGGNADLIFEAYPVPADIDRILALDNFFTFGSGPTDDQFFGALENVHNLLHNFVGGVNPNYKYDAADAGDRNDPSNPPLPQEPAFGDMQNGGMTAYDPIFWFHHGNVDRLWARWQQLHPDVGPDDPAAPLIPWNLTVADTSTTQKLGYEYVMDAHVFPTDPDTALVRFRSAPVTVAPHVLDTHRRAEIRVHTVQHVTRGGFHVRAFLNTPDASIATPTRGNDHYVGQVNMLTGLCIGGPGHCAVPKRSTNRFDKRPRHHKTPSNFRLDATVAVRALAATGVTDFHVNLIVLNTDGTPATDALLIDGVSLNFI